MQSPTACHPAKARAKRCVVEDVLLKKNGLVWSKPRSLVPEFSVTWRLRRAGYRIVLLADQGLGTMAIAAGTGASKPTVRRWQERFMEEGVDGLLRDKTRKPGTPPTPEAKVRELVETALAPPPGGETHWTVRALAAAVGIGASTAHVILARHRIAPRRRRHFKIPEDPQFEEKTCDITGPA